MSSADGPQIVCWLVDTRKLWLVDGSAKREEQMGEFERVVSELMGVQDCGKGNQRC